MSLADQMKWIAELAAEGNAQQALDLAEQNYPTILEYIKQAAGRGRRLTRMVPLPDDRILPEVVMAHLRAIAVRLEHDGFTIERVKGKPTDFFEVSW
jgi:hypothetical protein